MKTFGFSQGRGDTVLLPVLVGCGGWSRGAPCRSFPRCWQHRLLSRGPHDWGRSRYPSCSRDGCRTMAGFPGQSWVRLRRGRFLDFINTGEALDDTKTLSAHRNTLWTFSQGYLFFSCLSVMAHGGNVAIFRHSTESNVTKVKRLNLCCPTNPLPLLEPQNPPTHDFMYLGNNDQRILKL